MSKMQEKNNSELILPGVPSKDVEILTPESNKSTPLIFTGEDTLSYKQWQKAVDAVTPQKSLTYEQQVEEFLRNRKPTDVSREFRSEQIKSLPPNFCVFCGRTDITQDKTIHGVSWQFNETIEAVGIRAGDFVNCSGCVKCIDNIENERDFSPISLPEEYWEDRSLKRKEAVDKRIIEYIKSQRLAGVTGDIFGDESRRERFRDHDTTSY